MRDDLRFELLSEAEIKKCLPADLCVRVCPLCVPLDTVGAGLSALASTITQQERCHATVDRISRKPVVAFDPMMRDLIEEVCIGTGSPTGRMWSFAGHDASILGTHVPTGMMFVPSTGGISWCWVARHSATWSSLSTTRWSADQSGCGEGWRLRRVRRATLVIMRVAPGVRAVPRAVQPSGPRRTSTVMNGGPRASWVAWPKSKTPR